MAKLCRYRIPSFQGEHRCGNGNCVKFRQFVTKRDCRADICDSFVDRDNDDSRFTRATLRPHPQA